mgnify:CR=1 FL=1|jgi:accessory gene regulator B
MIESVSSKIIRCFLNQSIIDETHKDVYQYGLIVVIQFMITIISMIVIGLIFNLFFENLCFIIVFKLLRKFSGGLHSKKFSICFSVSIVLNFLILFVYRFFVLNPCFLIIIPIELVSSILLLFFSPIKNANKDISKNALRIYKYIETIICAFVMALSIVLVLNRNVYSYFICMAILVDTIFVVLGHIKN